MDNTALTIAVALQSLATLIIGVLVLAALRHLAYLYERLDPVFKFRPAQSIVRLGRPLPRLALREASGRAVDLVDELRGRAALILVVQADCTPCRGLLSSLGTLLEKRQGIWHVALVVAGPYETARELQQRYDLPVSVVLLADPELSVPRIWGIGSTPAAIVIGLNGNVESVLLAPTLEDVEKVLVAAPRAQISITEPVGSRPVGSEEVRSDGRAAEPGTLPLRS